MSRPRKNPLFITKICEGCKKEFTISSRKYRQRFCTKSCAQHDPSVLEKSELSKRKTYDEKYGGLHPMQTDKTKNAFKKSIFEKYGDDYFSNYLIKKTKKTKKEKYGDENYNNIKKINQTCLEKYGVKNFVYTSEYISKTKETCLKKYGVDHSSKSENFKLSHYENMFDKFFNDEKFKNFEVMFSKSEYNGVTKGIEKYKFKCKRCNNIDYHKISGGFYPLCVNCDKLNSSYLQKEIYDFIKTITPKNEIILLNDRSILYPKELDIYIPSLKLAIEFNGLYWHSEVSGNKNKTYHLNKFKSCLSKEINLIHIFENEWIYKQKIIKSVLKNHFKKIDNRIYARKCEIKEIKHKDSINFLNDNHLQGEDRSPIRLGLFYNNELVSIMTFCKSRFDKKYEYEISRFCNKLDTIVIGGPSKLFKYFLKTYIPKSIISYSDRRYFTGEIYKMLNFQFLKNTTPNYYYIINKYKNLVNRMKFQKHKLPKLLEIFDPSLTEWENMKNNGFDRIWDCGNSKWVFQSDNIKLPIKEI